MEHQYERKVVIVGKTGNGKSSLGNTLLGGKTFVEKKSFAAVTEECLAIKNKKLTVVDTPGLFDTDKKRGNLAGQALCVLKAIEICPKPHAFLIVLNGSVRLSEEEKSTVDVLKLTFGNEFLKHAIVVCTHVNQSESDSDFEERWKSCVGMEELIDACKNRVVRIDNTDVNPKHVDEIFKQVDRVSSNGTHVYDNVYGLVHREVLKNESCIERYNTEPIRIQVEKMLQSFEKARRETTRQMTETMKRVEKMEERCSNWAFAKDFAVQVVASAFYGAAAVGVCVGERIGAHVLAQQMQHANNHPGGVLNLAQRSFPQQFLPRPGENLNDVIADIFKTDQAQLALFQREIMLSVVQSGKK